MGIFDQFFGKNKPVKPKEKSQYLPEVQNPTEIEFAQNFTQRGGKFIYCENTESTAFYFDQILQENGWSPQDVTAQSEVLSSFFKLDKTNSHPQALVIHCEYLIANKGAILICNRQIQEKKLSELPQYLIIIATSNDFKNDVSEAMAAINKKYKNNLPSNITTLNAFDPTKENDFLSYGGSAKHLYLLVQEVNE
ncbi:MAG: LUD domain-containing protein [Flavobacteriaceae bacterium]